MTSLDVNTLTIEQFAKTIDHSLLRPELTPQDVLDGCELAARYHVASVCVKPSHVKLAVDALSGSDVAVGTVVGFPHGSNKTAVKVFEARQALEDGATELDVVLNIGDLRAGNLDAVREDIQAVVDVARGKALVKVILENAYLNDEQKVAACKACEQAGADFVKTSTGFAPGGATLEDLRLMRASVGPAVQVKAAGGVRSMEAALAVIEVGVIRIGATATAAMIDAFKERSGGSLESSAEQHLSDGY